MDNVCAQFLTERRVEDLLYDDNVAYSGAHEVG